MQSDKSVARNAQSTRCVKPESAGAFQIDPMESDLAPRGDSEKSSLPMSPILTAFTRIKFKRLDDQGLVAASPRRHECNDRPSSICSTPSRRRRNRKRHAFRVSSYAVAGFEIGLVRDIAPRAVVIGGFLRARARQRSGVPRAARRRPPRRRHN
jgi:hypothetical protein